MIEKIEDRCPCWGAVFEGAASASHLACAKDRLLYMALRSPSVSHEIRGLAERLPHPLRTRLSSKEHREAEVQGDPTRLETVVDAVLVVLAGMLAEGGRVLDRSSHRGARVGANVTPMRAGHDVFALERERSLEIRREARARFRGTSVETDPPEKSRTVALETLRDVKYSVYRGFTT